MIISLQRINTSHNAKIFSPGYVCVQSYVYVCVFLWEVVGGGEQMNFNFNLSKQLFERLHMIMVVMGTQTQYRLLRTL